MRLLCPSQPGSLSKDSDLRMVFGSSPAPPFAEPAGNASSTARPAAAVVLGRITLANVRTALFTVSPRVVADLVADETLTRAGGSGSRGTRTGRKCSYTFYDTPPGRSAG